MTITVTKTFATEAEAAAWLSGSAPAAAPAPAATKEAATPAKPAAKPAKPAPKPASENTREDMVTAIQALRTAKGKEAAVAVIKEVGGVDKLADIPDDKIDAVYDAAVAGAAEDEGM